MMQSNIFAKVEPLLREKKFNIDCNALVAFFSKYHKNDWVYPDALHRNLNMDIKLVYDILEICVEQNILEQYLQIYCPRCQRFTGSYYKTVFDIPSDVNCVHCDEDIERPLEHAIIIYRVL